MTALPSSAQPFEHHRTPAPADFDMREFLLRLRRHAALIAALTVVGGLAGAVVAWQTPKDYVATAKLFVRTTPDPPPTSELINRYRGIPNDPAIAKAVLADTGLDKPPYSFTVSALQAATVVRGGEVPDTILIDVHLPDAALAARAATSIATHTLNAAKHIEEHALQSVSTLKDRLQHAEADAATAEAAVLDFRRSSGIDKLRADLAGQAAERQRLPQMIADIDAENARLADAQRRLVETPQTILLKRVGSADAEDVVNPEYDALVREIVGSRERLVTLDSERKSAMTAIGPDIAEQVASAETRLGMLMGTASQAQSLRNQLAESYMQAAGIPDDKFRMELTDAAPVPSRPEKPQVPMNIAEGFAAGFMFAMVGAVLVHVVRL